MKLSSMFLIIIALQFSLLIFDSGHESTTPLFGFIQNPTNWSSTIFISLFGAIAIGLTLGSALVGTFFTKSDLVVFSPLILPIISWCIPIFSLFQLVYAGTSGMLCEGLACSTAYVIAGIVTAPIALMAIFTVIGWWRGNSEM